MNAVASYVKNQQSKFSESESISTFMIHKETVSCMYVCKYVCIMYVLCNVCFHVIGNLTVPLICCLQLYMHLKLVINNNSALQLQPTLVTM